VDKQEKLERLLWNAIKGKASALVSIECIEKIVGDDWENLLIRVEQELHINARLHPTCKQYLLLDRG